MSVDSSVWVIAVKPKADEPIWAKEAIRDLAFSRSDSWLDVPDTAPVRKVEVETTVFREDGTWTTHKELLDKGATVVVYRHDFTTVE